jgi:hypothetical protein
MATIGKYFVKGRFVGNFTTNQQKVLTSGEPFPKGDEHKVMIYRGIINQTEEIPVTNFDEAKGFYNFKEVDNIQINTSEKWPIKNDRIFSLYDMKLTHVEVFNVSEINGKTSGELRGNIIASVAEHPFNADNQEEPYNPGKAAEPFPTGEKGGDDPGGSDIGTNTPNPNPGGGDTGGDTTGGGNEITDRLDKFRKGCNTKWLHWLLYLLLILLLLYLLAKCTQAGQKIYCKIDNWRIVRKLEKVKQETDTLQAKIEQTEFNPIPCGTIKVHNGYNKPWKEWYGLGNQSGRVMIIFDARGAPDRMEVIYDGELKCETRETNFVNNVGRKIYDFSSIEGKGFGQYIDTFYFNYVHDKNKPNEMLIRVIPNKDISITRWVIDPYCPQ